MKPYLWLRIIMVLAAVIFWGSFALCQSSVTVTRSNEATDITPPSNTTVVEEPPKTSPVTQFATLEDSFATIQNNEFSQENATQVKVDVEQEAKEERLILSEPFPLFWGVEA